MKTNMGLLDKALKDVGRKKMKTDLVKIKTNHNKVEK
jgi:hypothetical protein